MIKVTLQGGLGDVYVNASHILTVQDKSLMDETRVVISFVHGGFLYVEGSAEDIAAEVGSMK